MTSPLHPELARLEAEYNRLIDAFEAGELTYEAATATLAHLVVVDGTGTQWGMDETGAFIRRRSPGDPGEVADPIAFAPAQLPPRASAGAPPWANPDLMSPPAGPNLHREGPPAFDPTAYVPSPVQAAGSIHDARSVARKSPGASPLARLTELVPQRVADLVTKNKRMLLIVAGCVAVLFAVSVIRGGDDDPTGGVPSASMPTDGPSASPVPTGDDASAVISALTSGKRDAAAAAVANPGDANVVARQTALLRGFVETELSVTAQGPAALEPDGASAVQTWQLIDEATKSPVGTAAVRWVKGPTGAWRLADWPAFA